MRLSILRQLFKPRERVACRLGERTECQTFDERTFVADLVSAGFFAARRNPYRHVGPSCHFLCFEKVSAHPGKLRVGTERAFHRLEHLTDAEFPFRTGSIVNSGFAA